MASRKKNYRHRNTPGRYEENFNSYKYANQNRSGQSHDRENHYFCDICGFTIPQAGNTPPMCTRCLIPMTLLRTASLNRSKSDKKQAYNYSARIYYQTDGHPQYKGLPLDHPDPDDLAAVEAYRARKDSARRRQGKSTGDDYRHSNRPSGGSHKRRTQHEPVNHQRHAADPKRSEAVAPESTDVPAVSTQETKESVRSSDNKRDRRRRSPSRRPLVPAQPIELQSPVREPVQGTNDSEYAGTALTSDRSAATILRDTMSETPIESNGSLHADYSFSSGDSEKTKRSTKRKAPAAPETESDA